MREKFIRSILILCIGATTTLPAQAQLGHSREYVEPRGWSLGMNVGLADLWGDVGTKSIVDHYINGEYFSKPHFMGGIFARYTVHPALALRLGVNYGTLYATDSWNERRANEASSMEEDVYQRYLRNQNVKANTWEGTFLIEFVPFRLNYEARRARKRFQPYLLAGVSYFHFKPTTAFTSKAGKNYGDVELYELNIEGNGLPAELYPEAPPKYDLWQLAIPLGIGVKWDIGRHLALGVECIYRMTFTDYLDNVSGAYINPEIYKTYLSPEHAEIAAQIQDRSWQIMDGAQHQPGELRGNSSNNDAFSTFGVTLIFKVPSKKSPWWY